MSHSAVSPLRLRRHNRAEPIWPRNDLRQYDDLVGEWAKPEGAFAALHWLAASRRELVPAPRTPHDMLVDVGCGGGLTADPNSPYSHVGVDLVASALAAARSRGVLAVQGNAADLPIATASAAVVVAGEILEHVLDLDATVTELCRILRPGGAIVIDTLNDTPLARFALVKIAERLPGGPPRGIHDPCLFVAPDRLRRLFAAQGVTLDVWGIRPCLRDYLRFLKDRRRPVRMLRTRSTALVYQGLGTKRAT